MKRISLILLLLTGLSAVLHAERYELRVGEFSRLKVTSGINVDYRTSADSAGMAVFDAPAEIASCIGFTPSGDELRVSFTTDERPEGVPVPRVTVYSSFLTQVVNTSDSTVRVLTVAPTSHFQMRQEGNGKVVVRDIQATRVSVKLLTGRGQLIVNGQCEEASLSITGTGLIQADGLAAQVVKVNATGTGQVGCWPLQELNVKGAGSTTVYYRGTPRIKKTFAIGVKVEPLQ